MTPPLAAVPDLDQELDALYALPLADFTRARDDLASRLKKAHQAEAGETVRALKKPSVVAWAANQLARESPDLVAELLAAGERLRETQQSALRGDAKPDEVNDATAAERDAVRALLGAARTLLGSKASPSVIERLGQTLRAAAVDDEARTQLARGRMTDELKAIGFGALEAVKPARRRGGDEVARAARQRVTALRAEARRLAAEAREAEAAAHDAQRTAEALAEEAAELRREADRAATELVEAEESLRARR